MHDIPAAVTGLEGDLREIFGSRFESLVVYSGAPSAAHTHTLAIVSTVGADDLKRCARKVAEWHDGGLATPLILGAHEFDRSLDAFPFEFGSIVASHVLVAGRNPFEGIEVDREDLRRACEVQARSHLLHLREGYIETRSRSDAVADLVNRSLVPFGALLKNVSRLGGTPVELPAEISRLAGAPRLSTAEAIQVFPAYLQAIEQIVAYVDRWSASR